MKQIYRACRDGRLGAATTTGGMGVAHHVGVHFASNATPAATKTAAIQRRLSTFSWRNHFADRALPTKVSDAAAAATRLTSAHESANKKLKNATAMQQIASAKIGLESTRRTTASKPLSRRMMLTSPILCI